MAVQVGVLGPVRAEVDGQEVELGGPAPRRLLAALAVSRGQAVSVDRLADAVWDGDPVPSAVGSLQVYVSGLRKALEPGRAPGAPAALAGDDPAGAGHALDAALALWRGAAWWQR